MAHNDIIQQVAISRAIIQPWPDEVFTNKNITTEVLRLDRIHPVISGNKWFKLKYHLQQALSEGKTGILTMGGAWSNHLVATALACQQAGLASIGIIRGEKPATLSDTLQEVQQYNMKLHFVSRESYDGADDLILRLQDEYPDFHIVPQGGQSELGVKGAEDIIDLVPVNDYTHIACAVGTATMLSGLTRRLSGQQETIGISSLKTEDQDNNTLIDYVREMAPGKKFNIYFQYHFGGFARKSDALLGFMNDLYKRFSIPTDFVYTGKLFYGLRELADKDIIPADSKLLLIHSGGLQGNRSLPAGTLVFPESELEKVRTDKPATQQIN